MHRLILTFCAVVIGGTGCTTFTWVDYSAPMTAVRRPADAAVRWGEYRIEMLNDTSVYEDDLVKALALPAGGVFNLLLTNKSEHSLQVVWDEAAYVGPGGMSSKVAPGESRMIDVTRSQPPTVVPPSSTANIVAIPVDHITDSPIGYSVRDFVAPTDPLREIEGKEFRLLIPVRVQGVTNEYTFVFEFRDLRLVSETPFECGMTCTEADARREAARKRGGN